MNAMVSWPCTSASVRRRSRRQTSSTIGDRVLLVIEMADDLQTFIESANHTRYSGQSQGHYESFFLRANHPQWPLAFWIRYTIFSPKGHPEGALGELWAVFFNAESGRHTAVKSELPLGECVFDRSQFYVRIGNSMLDTDVFQGSIKSPQGAISWDLSYVGKSQPVLLLPLKLYPARFPAAKSLVSLPMARFRGELIVNGERIPVEDWVGSQNHNWGRRHTDRYAWGQVAGFDTHPGSFLELATARLKMGPFWTPVFTPIVLRHGEREYTFTSLSQSIRAKGDFNSFHWNFKSDTPEASLEGVIWAPPESFVELHYRNPPGGSKICLNTKLAACVLRLVDKRRGESDLLETRHRAAFEILMDTMQRSPYPNK